MERTEDTDRPWRVTLALSVIREDGRRLDVATFVHLLPDWMSRVFIEDRVRELLQNFPKQAAGMVDDLTAKTVAFLRHRYRYGELPPREPSDLLLAPGETAEDSYVIDDGVDSWRVDYPIIQAQRRIGFELGRAAERRDVLAYMRRLEVERGDVAYDAELHARIEAGMHLDYPVDEGGER